MKNFKKSSSPTPKPQKNPSKGGKPKRTGKKHGSNKDPVIFGIHAVAAAISNEHRKIKLLMLTTNAAARIKDIIEDELPPFTECTPKDIDHKTALDTVHQGALLITGDLPTTQIDDLTATDNIVVLDQVTDPHNVGAIMRSAAAFGITHLIMTQRNSPPLSGTLAKSACGGLEHVKVILVGNLAQSLTKLGDLGYLRIGFDGDGSTNMEDHSRTNDQGVALILGAEEKGIRRLTKEHCDHICAIHAGGAFKSLNVSNAAAIAFHHFQAVKEPNG